MAGTSRSFRRLNRGGTDSSSDESEVDDTAVSLEQLRALRNVEIVTENEFPLAHLPREKVYRTGSNKRQEEESICYCEYPQEDEEEKNRCNDLSCLNFATYVECGRRCPAGKYCRNHRLQHPDKFPTLEAFKTEKKGFGVRTKQYIDQSSLVGEYVGEVIDQSELDRRLANVPRNELNFYYLMLEPGIFIDARRKGSFTRFVNHSCEPNCKTEKWTVDGITRIAVVALRDIRKGEELTFDYQWKALGSRQIKCYCGADSCKGFIGSESDLQGEVTPDGVFREPRAVENGKAIINRRLRVFSVASDLSTYRVATVISYDETTQEYTLEFEDYDDEEDEEGDVNMDEQRTKTMSLKGIHWQLFIDLEGLSPDQVQKEIFLIPKVQRPKSALSSSSAAEDTSSSPSRTRSTSPVKTQGVSSSVDFGNGPKTLLIKEIAIKCDEKLLRRLFSIESKTLGQAYASGNAKVIHSIEMLKMESGRGHETESWWALVECENPLFAKWIGPNLNGRPLFGKNLRVQFDGREVFERMKQIQAKRKQQSFSYSREHRTSSSYNTDSPSYQNGTPNRQESSSSSSSASPFRNTIATYCYGRKLDWLMSEFDQENNDPSLATGITQEKMDHVRVNCVRLIFRMVKNLKKNLATKEDGATAAMAWNHYYLFHQMNLMTVETAAASFLHIVLQASGRSAKIPWKIFLQAFFYAKHDIKEKKEQQNIPEQWLEMHGRKILQAQKTLLEGIRYDLSRLNPAVLLNRLLNVLEPFNKEVLSSEIVIEIKTLLPETMLSSVWVQFPMESIVLGIIYVSVTGLEVIAKRLDDKFKLNSRATGRLVLCCPPHWRRNESDRPNCTLTSTDMDILYQTIEAIMAFLKDRYEKRLEQKLKQLNKKRANSLTFDVEKYAKPIVSTSSSSSSTSTAAATTTTATFTSSSSPTTASTSTTDANDKSTKASTTTKKPQKLTVCQEILEILQRQLTKKKSSEQELTLAQLYETEGSYSRSRISSLPLAVQAIPKQSKKLPPRTADKNKNGPPREKKEEEEDPRRTRLCVEHLFNVEQIRKRAYLGQVDKQIPLDIAGRFVYLQPWPYRDSNNSPFLLSEHHGKHGGGVLDTCVRELSTYQTLGALSSQYILPLVGIVFPNERATQEQEDKKKNLYVSDYSSILKEDKYYLAFEQPLHIYSGLMEAFIQVSTKLCHKALYDLFKAVSLCHSNGYVHRFLATCHMFVFNDGIKLGGFFNARSVVNTTTKSYYELTESERKAHTLGACLNISAPEILLGDREFTIQSDLWSLGCILFELISQDTKKMLKGADVKTQLDQIYRLCGTPMTVNWKNGVQQPLYTKYTPKNEYRSRLVKTLEEKKNIPQEAIDVIVKLLQLDPLKRAKNVEECLEMPFFQAIRQQNREETYDFTRLPSSFDFQKKKMNQTNIHKNKGDEGDEGDEGGGGGGGGGGGISTSHRHRHRSSTQAEEEEEKKMKKKIRHEQKKDHHSHHRKDRHHHYHKEKHRESSSSSSSGKRPHGHESKSSSKHSHPPPPPHSSSSKHKDKESSSKKHRKNSDVPQEEEEESVPLPQVPLRPIAHGFFD